MPHFLQTSRIPEVSQSCRPPFGHNRPRDSSLDMLRVKIASFRRTNSKEMTATSNNPPTTIAAVAQKLGCCDNQLDITLVPMPKTAAINVPNTLINAAIISMPAILFVSCIDFVRFFDTVNLVMLQKRLLSSQVILNQLQLRHALFFQIYLRVMPNDLVQEITQCLSTYKGVLTTRFQLKLNHCFC